ncbi:MAG: AgmX/PglI C-terminal domain-containing protein [Deltaproteobacteria bacterium]|nr:AgmX/PglI C-terminal domain-containing protein [Deltaproteobacteria bacterium]
MATFAVAVLSFASPGVSDAKPEAKRAEKTEKAKKADRAAPKSKRPRDGASGEDHAFKERFAALTKEQARATISIKMRPTDDPFDLPATVGDGPVLVAGGRRGIYTPPLLSPDDILAVVNEQMGVIRKCYKAQLQADPEWNEEIILDLSVKKTGRISEISLAPGRVQRSELGKCLMAEIPKWKFPQFTGELDDGVTQEVVNASFPFSFSVR